jgi:hypothetical protein
VAFGKNGFRPLGLPNGHFKATCSS